MQYTCGLPASARGTIRNVQGQTQYRQWHPDHLITVGIEQAPPGISTPDFRQIIRTVISLTQSVCGVKAEYRSNWKTANIKVTTQQIDGDNGILAQAQLPGVLQNRGQIGCWNDSSMVRTRWVLSANPQPGEVDILRVDLHEIGGHNLGLGHAPQDGSPIDLMDPRISHLRMFQLDWDVPQHVARYGPPRMTRPTTTPAPTPDPSTRWEELLRDLFNTCSTEDMDTVRDVLSAWRDTR